MAGLSARLRGQVDALPLQAGMRVLEIGCGPGAAAREVARRVVPGTVVAIDRSSRAINTARRVVEDDAGPRPDFRCVAIEDFALADDEEPFDLAFAVRVGALDGRHPAAGRRAMAVLARVLRPGGLLVVDGVPIELARQVDD